MDIELQKQAYEWADNMISEFKKSTSPTYVVSGDALSAYQNLEEWEWFKDRSFDDIVIRKILAMQKYGKLLWAKGHPKKPKPSKWEIVTGKTKRKR